jgi:uncharacterized protein with HEPN domain
VPSKDPLQRFEDILDNIGRIRNYTEGLNSQSFLADHKTYDAVERCMERISEAASKLGQDAEELCPGIPWPQLRSLGNFLRHEYDRIEGERLWIMVERDLEPLELAAAEVLRRLSSDG